MAAADLSTSGDVDSGPSVISARPFSGTGLARRLRSQLARARPEWPLPTKEDTMSEARIGLIAVSGVRVHNERLQRLGVTLPGFVERARVIASMPSLGLLT